jgi:hypothetical protein
VETDTLNSLVSGAIWRAEQLEARGIPSSQAWAEVSSLDEELAKVHSVSESEGRIARRGAVRAALKARDHARATALLRIYSAEKRTPESLRVALRKIIKEDDQAMAKRFPFAAERHSPSEARTLAARFHETGAFGLAA